MMILAVFLLFDLSRCLSYSSIAINHTVQAHQISQYRDTVKGCSGLQCFTINITELSVLYSMSATNPSLVGCNFTNYLMVQQKLAKLWHFQVCNMSSNQTTAGQITLKYENLKTGNKFESSYATFGKFISDTDFPWFYSKAASQMVQPWYFMRTFLKLSFNVNSDKIIMAGNARRRGYQKSRNKSDTVLYRLQGYPDDIANHSVLASDMAINISQMVMAANGHYIVYLKGNGPSLQIYNTTQQKITYEQKINATNDPSLCSLTKINETHIGLAVGGLSAWVGIWDLRIPALILDLPIPTGSIDLANDTILTIFSFNLALGVHSSACADSFHIFTDLPVLVQPNYQYMALAQQSLVCKQPAQIIGASCLICNFECLLCDSLNLNRCTLCSFGFNLQQGTRRCVPSAALRWVVNGIAALGMLNIGGYFWVGGQYLDTLFMLAYQNLRFDSHAQSALRVAHFASTHRFFPYSLQLYLQSARVPLAAANPSLPQSRSLMLPSQYARVMNIWAYPAEFASLVKYIGIWGVIIQVLTSLVLKWMYCKIMGSLGFGKCIKRDSILMILMVIMQSRITYVTFHFFNQVKVPSFIQPIDKMYIAALVLIFFLVLTYSACGHLFIIHFCGHKSAQTMINSHYKPMFSSLLFISLSSGFSLLSAFAFSFLNQLPIAQKIMLIVFSLVHFASTIKHFEIYEITMNLCIELFMRVTMILFFIMLLLDELNCPEFFEVSIKVIELIILAMISILTVCQAMACLGIAALRLSRSLVAFASLSSKIEQRVVNFEVLKQIAHLVDQNGDFVSKRNEKAGLQIYGSKIANMIEGEDSKKQESRVEVDAQSIKVQQTRSDQSGKHDKPYLVNQNVLEVHGNKKQQIKQSWYSSKISQQNESKLVEFNSSEVSLFKSFLSLLKSSGLSQDSTNSSFQAWNKNNKVHPESEKSS